MEEKELKTSTGQRLMISAVAIVMLLSVIISYAAIVIGGSKKSSEESEGIGNDRVAYYEEGYYTKLSEFKAATGGDFDKFWQYKGAIVAFDEDAANNNGVTTRDYLAGTGKELTAEDTNYLAYYVGWCADASIFDSSLDDSSKPEGFAKALDASQGMIDGWNTGVVGMKLGGVREITIPGAQAYGDRMELCGGYNKPLKFLVMPVENADPLASLAREVDEAYLKMYYAYYGIDYEKEYGK